MTSVTFRKKSIAETVKICKAAGLSGIEWGGDVHVPPMSAAAKEAAKLCFDEGLKIFSYGSYFSVQGENYFEDFQKTADTCGTLGTDTVRIWATRTSRDEASAGEYVAFIEKMKRIADEAAKRSLIVCFEHHQKTYADSLGHTCDLLSKIGSKNVKTYWQPICAEAQNNLISARELKTDVQRIHVYYWRGHERFLLSKGGAEWRGYSDVFATEKREIPCLLEFVKDDSDENFFADAKTLLALTAEANRKAENSGK